MKVYTRNHLEELNHPEDMGKIMAYLESHGTLHVNARTVENLYYDFSETYDAGWLIVNDDRLEEFADWLIVNDDRLEEFADWLENIDL